MEKGESVVVDFSQSDELNSLARGGRHLLQGLIQGQDGQVVVVYSVGVGSCV